jgi:hypothetical protein
MSAKNYSTRRSFLKRGALFAVPLAAAAPAAVIAEDSLKERLARLENETAIRRLHQNWLRRINTGAGETALLFADAKYGTVVRGIASDHSGEPDNIEIARDGKSATGRFHCVVETESTIVRDCTLAEMAHAQGSGFVRHAGSRVLDVEYVKASGGWAIAKAEFAPV